MGKSNETLKKSAEKLLRSSRKIVCALELDELENSVEKLVVDMGALIVKVVHYSKSRSGDWQKIQKFVHEKKLNDQIVLGRVCGCEFEAVVKDNSLEIKFKTFGQRLNINLITGEFAGGNSLDIIYALSISSRIFEPAYWQKFFQEAASSKTK